MDSSWRCLPPAKWATTAEGRRRLLQLEGAPTEESGDPHIAGIGIGDPHFAGIGNGDPHNAGIENGDPHSAGIVQKYDSQKCSTYTTSSATSTNAATAATAATPSTSTAEGATTADEI